MILCITSEGQTGDSRVDVRFGRSPYFIFYDVENDTIEAAVNPHVQFSQGAGIQSAQLMITKGVKAVLTGNVGPNAFQVLTPAGIDVYVGASGTVKEAIANFKSGKVIKAESPGPGKQSRVKPY